MHTDVKNFYAQNKNVKSIDWTGNRKAVITLKNGKTEVYDINIESERRNFEKKYGTLPPPPPPPPPVVSVPVVARSTSVKGQIASVKVKGVNSTEPVYYLDGKTVASIESVHPNDIASVEVYKGQTADIKYGAGAGKNGVVVITSKSAQPAIVASTSNGVIANSNDIIAADGAKASNKPDVIVTQANDRILADERMANALFYINGKEVTREIMLALDPAKINRMDVYRSPDAVKKFGEKGKNGIVKISTK
jgi:hypothetical protein